MKRYLVLLALAIAIVANADQTPLNTVSFTASAEQWATTDTALVSVSADAVLNKESLAKMRSEIMDKLTQIAKSNWQVVAFERSQDQSGLERLHIEAQARVKESDLTDINANAKKISKPGQTYRVNQIQFTPTLAEMEQTKAAVRAQIYTQAKLEIAKLDQTFPNQQFFVRDIQFQPMAIAPGELRMMVAAKVAEEPAPVAVNTKVVETAVVTLGSQLPKSAN